MFQKLALWVWGEIRISFHSDLAWSWVLVTWIGGLVSINFIISLALGSHVLSLISSFSIYVSSFGSGYWLSIDIPLCDKPPKLFISSKDNGPFWSCVPTSLHFVVRE